MVKAQILIENEGIVYEPAVLMESMEHRQKR